jgi:uncharacterized protein DUF3761
MRTTYPKMRSRLVLIAIAAVAVVPAATAAPPGATARCVDGTYSYSQHHSGTCSHHGGVAQWLDGSGSAHAKPSSGSTVLGPRTRTAGCRSAVLPDRRCSPGAYDPRVSQANIGSTICVSGYSESVRNVPESEKRAVYAEYGITHHAPYSYEVDHIVSLELGGSNDIANLYPESYTIADGARVKDRLENWLHRAVCDGGVPLRAAQRQIATNWLVAYHRYLG